MKALRPLLRLALALAVSVAARDVEAQRFQDFVALDGPVAITNVKLIDGTGAPARDGQTIVIQGDRITAVGPTASVRIPSGARVMDLPGHTVIPGLIGLHNHSYYTAATGGRLSSPSRGRASTWRPA